MRRIATVLFVLTAGWVGEARAQLVVGKPKDARPVVAEGASFAEPKGWIRLDPDRKSTKGWFLAPNSPPNDPKRMIMVDVGKPTKPDAKTTAESLARDWGGRAAAEPAALDGVEGYRVRVEERKKPGMRPVEAIVVHRDGKAYMLMGGAIPGQSIAAELEEVRKGWKWVETK
jgi:hypothetical protein